MEEKIDTTELEMIKRLAINPDFQKWVEIVVEHNLDILEKDLASPEADKMPEAVLRGKLKQVNSLKYIFRDVFQEVHSQLEMAKEQNSKL